MKSCMVKNSNLIYKFYTILTCTLLIGSTKLCFKWTDMRSPIKINSSLLSFSKALVSESLLSSVLHVFKDEAATNGIIRAQLADNFNYENSFVFQKDCALSI